MEYKLILAYSRLLPQRPAYNRREASGDPPIDWPRLLRLAGRHGLLPLMTRSLGLCPIAGQPRDLEKTLADKVKPGLGRAIRHAAELIRVAGALETAGVPVLSLKGPLEAVRIYGDIGLRPVRDIDLYVRPADAGRAGRLLGGLGYRPLVPEIAARLGSAWIAPGQATFRNASAATALDLHWRLAETSRPLFDMDRAISLRTERSFEGARLHTLPDEARFLHLCQHGSSHGWSRLIWLCDIAEILRNGDTGDAGRIRSLARASGQERGLLLACHLAATLLDAPLPAALADALQPDGGIGDMARRITRDGDRDAAPDRPDTLAARCRSLRRQLWLQDGVSARAGLLWRRLLPAARDLAGKGPQPVPVALLRRMIRLLALPLRRTP